MASALAWRLAVRRFHIFIFQCRGVRVRLATLSLATSGSWWCAGFQAAPGSCTSAGIEPGADLVGHVLQLDVDPVPLAVGLGPQLLLRRQRHLGGAVALAHRATSSLRSDRAPSLVV